MDMPTGRKRVLVFCRNYLVEIFRKGAEPLADRFDFRFLTDGVCSGTRDTRRAFYAALALGARSAEITPEDEEDIVARCRFLRNIDRTQASRLVHAIAVTLGDELDRLRPDAVLSQMVDEYVTHILGLLAQKRGLGYVAYCWSYFPGRALLMADSHGRPFRWREADAAEAEADVLRISDRSFRRNYNQSDEYSWRRHIYLMLREKGKSVFYAVRKLLTRDPWNIHYNIMPYCAVPKRLRDYPSQSWFEGDWRGKIARLREQKPGAPLVYMPLAFVPESTTDYWISNRGPIDYEAFVGAVLSALTADCIVLVKEHAHMMGRRDRAFLKGIMEHPGTVSIPPQEPSNEVVALSDAVLLGAGSAGVETTVGGKPVFTYCDTSYWFDISGATALDIDRLESWGVTIRAGVADHEPMDPTAQVEFIAACLASTARTQKEAGVWPEICSEDLRSLLHAVIARAHNG